MDNKGISIDARVKVSTEEFDRAISKMKKQAEEFSKIQSMAGGGALGGRSIGGMPSPEGGPAFSERTLKAFKDISSERRKMFEDELKAYTKAADASAKMRDEFAKHIKAALATGNEEAVRKLRGLHQEFSDKVIGFGKLAEKAHEGFVSAGGVSDKDGTPAQKEEKLIQKTIKAALIAGTINQVVGAVSAIYRHEMMAESGMAAARAGAMSPINQELRAMQRGGGTEAMYNLQYRANAARIAAREQLLRPGGDILGSIGGIAASTAGGAAMGSALLGPGIGTGVGAGVGLIGGFAHSRMYDMIFHPDKYRMESAQEAAKSYQANILAEQAANPRRTMAMEDFQANKQRYLQFQRMFGMSDEQFITGYKKPVGRRGGAFDPGEQVEGLYQEGWLTEQMKRGGKTGFTREDIMGAAMGLVQSGAGTSQGLSLAADVAQFQRNMGQTNAGSIMGRMAGAGMSGDQTQALLRMMEAAVTKGIINSNMPQELMRFTETATSIAIQGGGYADSVSELMGQALQGSSLSQIQAAGGAVSKYEERAGAEGGLEGQFGYAFLMSKRGKELFGDLGATSMAALNEMTAADLERDPKLLKAYANKYAGGDQRRIIEMVREKDSAKQIRSEKLAKKYEEYSRIENKESDEGLDLYREIVELENYLGGEKIREGKSAREAGISLKTSLMKKPMIGPMRPTEGEAFDPFKDIFTKFTTAPQTAAEADRGAVATGQLEGLKNLSEYLTEIKNNAEAFTGSAAKLNLIYEKYEAALRAGGTSMMQLQSQIQQAINEMKMAGFVSTVPETKQKELQTRDTFFTPSGAGAGGI